MTARHRILKARIDDKLDQALRDSFPASDPVSFLEPAPAKDGDRKLPVIEADRAKRRERPDESH